MHGAMLRRSNGFIRNLGAGTRQFGKLPQHHGLLLQLGIATTTTTTTSASQIRLGLISKRENSSLTSSQSSSSSRIADTRDEESSQLSRLHATVGTTFRNARMSKALEFARQHQKSRKRKLMSDDKGQVAMLMELAKGGGNTRSLPRGVNATVVAKEIQWLKDPRDLAQRVNDILQRGDVALAVAIIHRAESLKMETTVAWNYLLTHCISRGAPLAAFRFYNDMKKRARRPNSHTYTIMLQGMCQPSHQAGAKSIEIARKIYSQLVTPDSDVTPNHHHYHAIIEACGAHNDMDTLWQVVGEMPEVGEFRPNSQTYTVILLALQESFDHSIADIPEDQMELRTEKRQSLLIDAKRIWADVVSQWADGQLVIDPELVSTMAWVLNDPMDEQNSYNVLALYRQVMDIPIFAEEPTSRYLTATREGRWEGGVRSNKEKKRPTYTPWQPVEQDSEYTPLSPGEDDLVENLETVFEPVAKAKGTDGPALLAPDNRVLNLVLSVCRVLTNGSAAGRRYWNLFTLDEEGYHIHPDEGNFHEYLRLLRMSRSSAHALTVISKQMVPAGMVEGKTFHIALSCCLRDKLNPNVFVIAQELLSIMHKQLALPDHRPLRSFMDLTDSLVENPQLLLGLKGLGHVDQGATMSFALLGRKMRYALQKAAIKSLEPHMNRYYESMQKRLESSLPSGSKPYILDVTMSETPWTPTAVRGSDALALMVKFREMLDKILGGPQFKDSISKSDYEWIHSWALKLRKFSKPEVVEQFGWGSIIRPLQSHYTDLWSGKDFDQLKSKKLGHHQSKSDHQKLVTNDQSTSDHEQQPVTNNQSTTDQSKTSE